MTAGAPLVKGAEHHLYVIELIGLGVKVGVTADPKTRLAAHRRDAAAFGREIGEVWVSEPHVEARQNERQLMRLAGPAQRREYLPIAFADAKSAALGLPMTRADREAVERKNQAASDFFKAFVTGGRS